METKTNRIRSKNKKFVKKPTPSAAYLDQAKKPQRKSAYSPHRPKDPTRKAQESFTIDMKDTQHTWQSPKESKTYFEIHNEIPSLEELEHDDFDIWFFNPNKLSEDVSQEEILNAEWIRNWSKEMEESKHSIHDEEEVNMGKPTKTMSTNQEPTDNDPTPSTPMEETKYSTNQEGMMHQKNLPLEELKFEIDPGYQKGTAQFRPKIAWNNKIDPGYVDGSAVFKPKMFIVDEPNKEEGENDRKCFNGIKNCPYIVCEVTRDGTPRPVYGFPQMTSCGKSYKSEFCTHEYCHDPRLRLAAGDSYALRAQLKLNKTGIYKPVPPLNFKEEFLQNFQRNG